MTINDAINRVGEHIKNTQYTEINKIQWLSALDKMVKSQIIDTHADGDRVEFTGYDEDTDMNTELLVPFPYDDMYIKWLEAQIYYTNNESVHYNNAIMLFNTAYAAYEDYYNRTHAPLRAETRFLF